MAKPSFEEFKRAILKASAIAFDPNDALPKVTLWMPEIEALFNSLTRPDWTPVSEALPDDGSKEVLVTVRRKDGAKYVDTDWCAQGQWLIHNDEEHHRVIAHMPLPQPYEPTDE